MLAIRCQFLQGTYQASPPGRLGESEWPPHPARLHAALVAVGWALSDGEFPAEATEALGWLEEQPPPLVVAPPRSGAIRTSPTTFVPRNLTRAEVNALTGHLHATPPRTTAFQRESGRVSRTFPTRVVGDEPVWFVWPGAEAGPPHRAALERLVGNLQYLGSSRSPVVGASFAGSSEMLWEAMGEAQTFEPVDYADSDGIHLRIASPGLTEKLLQNRDAGSQAPLAEMVAYRREPDQHTARSNAGAVVGRDRGEKPHSVEAEPLDRGPFTMLPPKRRAGFGLTLSHASTITAALRAACLAVAGDAAPAILHGHGEHPHAAFLALPNVGGQHSDGAILGVGIAVPNRADHISKEEVNAVRAAFAGVDHLNVEQGSLRWQLTDVPAGDSPQNLQAQRWAGPARRWSTATPVILDRYPKANRGFSLEDAIKLAFRNALLPEPSEGIEASPTPMLGGGVAPALHIRPERLRGLAMHITVAFPRRVLGPILVGKGRYLGLGLFAPLPERAESPTDLPPREEDERNQRLH
jgi:CRISPR-associated protein Csb2